MTTTAAALQPGATLTATATAIITAATTGQTIVTQAVFSNPTGASVNVVVTVTRSGGTTLTLIPSRAVAAGSTLIPAELMVFPLNTGDVISASGAGIVCFANGYTIT